MPGKASRLVVTIVVIRHHTGILECRWHCFVAARRKKHSNIAACKYRRLDKDGVGGRAADGQGAASDALGGWPLRLVIG